MQKPVRGFASIAALCMLVTTGGGVLAQTPPKPAPPPAMPDVPDPPAESTPAPETKVPREDPTKPLSQELRENDGVLEPPRDLDSKIEKPAPVPEPNTTPVLPPPGSPGGDQSIRPK